MPGAWTLCTGQGSLRVASKARGSSRALPELHAGPSGFLRSFGTAGPQVGLPLKPPPQTKATPLPRRAALWNVSAAEGRPHGRTGQGAEPDPLNGNCRYSDLRFPGLIGFSWVVFTQRLVF